MRRFWNNLPTWAQVGMVLGVVTLISFMFPTGVKFDYAYEQGERWRYDDLSAPFAFPMVKPQAEIDQEVEEIKDRQPNYYLQDQALTQRSLDIFEKQFQENYQNLGVGASFSDLKATPNRYLELGKDLLDRAYSRGIASDELKVRQSKQTLIKLVKGNLISEVSAGSILEKQEVLTQLADSLQLSRLKDASFLVPLLDDALLPNVRFSDSLTTRFLEAQLKEVSRFRGMVEQGELIIMKDGIVTEDITRKLDSYKFQYEQEVVDSSRGWLMFLGYLLLTSIIMSVLLLYIRVFHAGAFSKFNRLVFILMLVLIASFAVFRIDSFNSASVYLMPFAIVPIVIKNFYPPGVALFTHLVIVLIASFLSSLGYEFTFLQIVVGIVAVLSPTGPRDWSKILRSLLLLALTYFLGYIGLELIKEGNWREIDWTILGWLSMSVFLTMLAYPLVPLLGRLFGFTSDVVLLELSDVNRPVLRELGLRAPGTLQHSLAVSNLAEAAVREIGGNTLLVKVAALYHDIGKTTEPRFFIENQTGRNPHDDLTASESAQVIIDHVTEGVRLGKKAGLPSIIIDFIKTHHGTQRVEYFWRTHLSKNPSQEVDDSAFRYPGPVPSTKEQTVLMLADSIEAAGRSLKDPTHSSIEELVDKIIKSKGVDNQLINSELSFQELEACRKVFKSMLKSMYHARVEYPEDPLQLEN